jgi:nucleoside-diphosphate-sugar epimerase
MKEEVRLAQIEERLKKSEDNHQILLLGASSHIASHILNKFLDAVPNSHITIADAKDPNIAFLNPALRHYKGTSRVTTVQSSPHDWEWLEVGLDSFDTIINASCVHDSIYCHNNPIDSAYRNSMQAVGLMTALQRGRGWKSDGKLIIISSDKVYGHQEHLPIPETAPLNPAGIRASTRAQQEIYQTGMARALGIPFVCLRLGSTYGEYSPAEKSIYAWCRALLLNQPLKMHGEFAKNDSPARDWVHLDDVSAVVGFCTVTDWDTNMKNEIFNIGANEKHIHYIWNIAEAMKTVLRRGTTTIRAPWREPGERNLKIWLDSKKAEEKLFWLPSRDLVFGATRLLAPWIAYHDLLWSEEQIIELKRSLGIRDSIQGQPPKGSVGSGAVGHLTVQA